MRVLAISFGLWVLLLPSIVGSILIVTALAAFVPPLYFAVVWIGVAFSAVALVCGPFLTAAPRGHAAANDSDVIRHHVPTKLIRGEKQ